MKRSISAASPEQLIRLNLLNTAGHKSPRVYRSPCLRVTETGRVVLDPSTLRKRFKAALEHAGLRSVRFHDLRHTYGTLMAGAGTPLRVLQEWMGHRDYKTTLIYADYAPDEGRGVHFTRLAFGASGSAAQASRGTHSF